MIWRLLAFNVAASALVVAGVPDYFACAIVSVTYMASLGLIYE